MTQNTNKPKIALLDPGIASCTYEEQLFSGNGYRFEIFPGEKGDYEGKMKFAADAAGLLIRFTEINEYFLAHTPHLKAIARYGVGYDNIDLEACTHAGVRCANVRGYGNHSVSDHALALMLSWLRMLPAGHRNIFTQFGASPSDNIPELREITLGIIGLGRIGSTLAQKAAPIVNRVIAHDPYVSDRAFEAAQAEKVNFEQLLKNADVISIHCNLTEETNHLINREAFNLMQKKPILINTARGPIIDETALLQALQESKVHAAGLDVFHTELPEELSEKLVNHPHVIATGHYAWFSNKASEELKKRTADNLLALLQNKIPEDCLNP